MNFCVRIGVGLLWVIALLPFPLLSHAQTNVGDAISDTVGGVIKGEVEKKTGLDKVKNVKDISAGDVANAVVKEAIGGIPSPVLGSLLNQLGRSHTVTIGQKPQDGLFKPYTLKRPFGEGNLSAVNPVCERVANQRMMEGIQNAEAKAAFGPWAEISWEAVKVISDGGKTIGELIAENTKAKVEGLIKEALFGKEPPAVEKVTIPHHDSCNTETTILWDAANGKLKIVTTGNCGCNRYNSEGSTAYLNDFTVTLTADVTLKEVNINEKEVGFWFLKKKTYTINRFYKISNIVVDTKANCDKQCPKDLVDPPPEKGLWDRFVGWVKDTFLSEPEDQSEPPEEDGGDGTGEDEDGNEEASDENTTGSFWEGLFGGRDKTEEPKDQVGGENEDENTDESTEKPPKNDKPLQCGDRVSVDGRSSVPTFPFRPDANGDVNFSCNNSCSPDQVCKVLPESVNAFRDACVYCAEKPKEEKSDPPQPPRSGGKCEEAIRLLLDEYVGWFDPPLSFSANGAVFSNGPHRCLDDTEFKQYHVDLVVEGAADAKVRALCPTLKVVSNENIYLGGEGKGATCNTKSVFSF